MSLLRSRVFLSGAIIALTLVTVPARSTIITVYTSRAMWLAAVTGAQTLDFSGLAPAGSAMGYPTGWLSPGGLKFTSSSGNLNAVDTTGSPYFNFGTGVALSILYDRPTQPSPAPNFHVTIPSGVTAFGVDLFTSSPSGFTFSIVTLGNTYSAPTFSMPTLAFFGITSDTPINTVDLMVLNTVFNGGNTGYIDNFSYGTTDAPPAETSEAASIILIGSGLVLLGALQGRKRRLQLAPA